MQYVMGNNISAKEIDYVARDTFKISTRWNERLDREIINMTSHAREYVSLRERDWQDGFRVYLDRSDAANKRHDVAEHVIGVEKQSQRVRYVTGDDLDQEEGRGEEQH